MRKNAIVIEEIEKIYGYGSNALKVLKKISLTINGGEILSIVGPSGAGKSTLLNMIGCLDGFQSGKIKSVHCEEVWWMKEKVKKMSDF